MGIPRDYQKYVLGFLFSTDKTNIVLMEKYKPEINVIGFNGVGGKVKQEEFSLNAMQRKFLEEASDTPVEWKQFGSLTNSKYRIDLFVAFADIDIIPKNKEWAGWYSLEHVKSHLMLVEHVDWMIPLALDETCINTESYMKDLS
jgi:8-oxo-dGTP diphosphatase